MNKLCMECGKEFSTDDVYEQHKELFDSIEFADHGVMTPAEERVYFHRHCPACSSMFLIDERAGCGL